MPCEGKLLGITQAGDALGLRLGLAQNGQEQAGEYRDDGNHHQQLDECEGIGRSVPAAAERASVPTCLPWSNRFSQVSEHKLVNLWSVCTSRGHKASVRLKAQPRMFQSNWCAGRAKWRRRFPLGAMRDVPPLHLTGVRRCGGAPSTLTNLARRAMLSAREANAANDQQ